MSADRHAKDEISIKAGSLSKAGGLLSNLIKQVEQAREASAISASVGHLYPSPWPGLTRPSMDPRVEPAGEV
jgi:hypothetical protein